MGNNLIFVEKVFRDSLFDLMENNDVESLSVTKIGEDSFITEEVILKAGAIDLWLHLIVRAGGNFIIKIDKTSIESFNNGFDELYKINK